MTVMQIKMTMKVKVAKGQPSIEVPKVVEGYVGRPKGLKQVLWERGRYVEGMSKEQMEVSMAAGADFRNEKSQIEELLIAAGHLMEKSPKGHPELAGAGIEYCWGKSKMHFRSLKLRRTTEVFEDMVRESLSKDVLKLRTVRRFARKARSMRRLYASKPDANTRDYAAVEALYAERKAHRSCADLFVSFIKNTE